MYSPAAESSIDELTALAREVDRGPALVEALANSWPALCAQFGTELRAIMDDLPSELWQSDPWLIAGYASTYRSLGSPQQIGIPALLLSSGGAPRGIDDLPAQSIGIALHHAAALRSLGRLDEAIERTEHAERSLEQDTSMPLAWRIGLGTKICLQRGITLYHLGDFDGAMTDLRSAGGLAASTLYPHEQVECFAALAMAEYSAGEFDHSLRNARQARVISADSGLLVSPFGAAALIAELIIAVEQNRRDDAEHTASVVSTISERSEWAPLSLYARATVSIISEDYIGGLDLLRQCLQAYRRWTPPGMIVTVSEGLRATLLLRLGDTATAWDILGALSPTQHHANCPARFIAHLRFVTGDVPGTLAALRACEALGDSHSARTLVDVLLLKAAAHYELDRATVADVAFDRALVLAAHNDMRIPFRLVPGDVMRSMLDRAVLRPQSPAVTALFDGIGDADTAPGGASRVRLSEREREIVRALMKSLTVNEIAEEMFISVNTVKSHLKNIYRKLGVSSRSGAIKRARELGHQLEITL